MKKGSMWLIGLAVVLVVAIGGYAIFHKSSTKTSSTTKASTASQSSVPPVNNAVFITKTDPTLGQYLADPSGKALYTYGADSSGASNCSGSCLATWPAYVDSGATTGLPAGVSTIKRSDNGQVQYTYNGMPLYYFVSDSNGQVTGDGVNNFHVAKPAAISSPPSTSSSQPSNLNSTSSNTNSPYSY